MQIKDIADKLKENISKVIVGKEDVLERVIVTVLCSGHILLEDIPGTGKTTLAKALSKSIDCDFKRVQFTPDLLPSDLTGINFYNQKVGEFIFKQGAIFTNILLADEINRATPRTQSSLLECMEERQATIDGITYKMAEPFIVIATQNPVEIQGTFPLPEAQLDRFFMRLSMGYPSFESELGILENFILESPLATLESIASIDDINNARRDVKKVKVSQPIREYILKIVNETREHDKIRLGVSPRGSLAFLRAVQGYAAVKGRDYVIPDDVKAIACDVLCHRIICKSSGLGKSGTSARDIINQIIEDINVPIE